MCTLLSIDIANASAADYIYYVHLACPTEEIPYFADGNRPVALCCIPPGDNLSQTGCPVLSVTYQYVTHNLHSALTHHQSINTFHSQFIVCRLPTGIRYPPNRPPVPTLTTYGSSTPSSLLGHLTPLGAMPPLASVAHTIPVASPLRNDDPRSRHTDCTRPRSTPLGGPLPTATISIAVPTTHPGQTCGKSPRGRFHRHEGVPGR